MKKPKPIPPLRPVDVIFPKMKALRDQGKCPTCGAFVTVKSFRDELSFQEFNISGLCQKCQDKVFK